jgi:3-hydroxyisobutyrate dehydrogenase
VRAFVRATGHSPPRGVRGEATDEKQGPRVGFVGLGAMGAPMASRLAGAGFTVAVHNRTRDEEIPLERAGAERAASPSATARDASAVITIVGDTSDVEWVLFGSDGIAEGAAPETLIIDMSTIDPEAARGFGARLNERGIRMVDAPVSGGTEGAINGTLSIMAGGAGTDVEEARTYLAPLGTVIHIGPIGSGQMAKAINQVIVAGTFLSVAEGMALGVRAGLDMDRVLQAVGAGAAGSWALQNRAPRMLAGDFPLGFKVRLHLKDLAIALKTADEIGVDLPATRLVAELEEQLVENGYGDSDISAMISAIRGFRKGGSTTDRD